MPFSAIGFRQQ